MRRNHVMGWLLGLSVSLVGTTAWSALVVEPSDLTVGQSYRLVFVTGGMMNPTSDLIADYDQFVPTQAALSAELTALGATWQVIGSTPTINAKAHTATDPSLATGVPVYNLAGQRVADDYIDLWDGTLGAPINIDQYGQSTTNRVFTGTASDGTPATGHELGANGFRVRYGRAHLSTGGWTNIDWLGTGVALPYYGISQELTMVPEPMTLALLGLGGLALLSRRR